MSSDKIEGSAFVTKYIHSMTKYMTIPFLCPISSRGLFRLHLSTRERLQMYICPRDVNHELDRLSPLFWTMYLLVAGGSVLRLLCFRILEKFFTFEVTIRSNHKILDFGPYGIVRHPSYTDAFSIWGGTTLWVFSSQNPAITCGWAASFLIVRLIMASWMFAGMFFCYTLVRRVFAEEKVFKSISDNHGTIIRNESLLDLCLEFVEPQRVHPQNDLHRYNTSSASR